MENKGTGPLLPNTSAPDAATTVTSSDAIPFTEPRGDLLIMTDTHPWLTVVAKNP
jgi:hypothetical protein